MQVSTCHLRAHGIAKKLVSCRGETLEPAQAHPLRLSLLLSAPKLNKSFHLVSLLPFHRRRSGRRGTSTAPRVPAGPFSWSPASGGGPVRLLLTAMRMKNQVARPLSLFFRRIRFNMPSIVAKSSCPKTLIDGDVNDNGGSGKTHIYLNIYDISPVNNYLYCFGLGIFHSGIEGASLMA